MNQNNDETVAEKTAEQLHAWGVRYVFGTIGDSIGPLVSAMKSGDGPYFVSLQSAKTTGLCASAYAKITGELGVCFADAGPAAAYLINGAYDAYYDSVPLLALSGQSPQHLRGTSYQQTTEPNLTFAGCTSFSATGSDPVGSLHLLRKAMRTAHANNTSAHLALPRDVQMYSCPEPVRQPPYGAELQRHKKPQMDPQLVHQMAEEMAASDRPVIVFGQSARNFAPQLWRFASALPAPMVCTLPAVGVFPSDEPLLMGVVGDAGTPPPPDPFRGRYSSDCWDQLVAG